MIKCAEQSPRVCNDGTIRWYEGDTFELEFDLTFTDSETGQEIETNPTDELTVCFRDTWNNIIYETSVIGTNKLVITIDKETTKKFKEGKYKYCVKRNSNFITTIMRKNMVVVE